MDNDLLAYLIVNTEPKSPINQYKARAIKRGRTWMAMMYMDSSFHTYQDLVKSKALEWVARTKQELYTGPVRVEAKFYFGSKRRKDLQNAAKLELDALNEIIYEDDSQIHKLETEKHYDKTNPRAEIKIYKYPSSDWPID